MRYIKTTFTLVFSLFLFAACGSKSSNKATDMVNKTKSQMQDQGTQLQTQFVSKIQDKLDDMETGMNEVKAAVDKASGEKKESLQGEWLKLKNQKKELETMIQKVKDNKVDDWGQFKTDMQNQWTQLKGTYKDLRGRLEPFMSI